MSAIFDRILPILEKNYSLENRSPLWEWCMSHSKKVELTEENLENFGNNNLNWGFFGGTASDNPEKLLIKFAKSLGILGIQNPENGDTVHPRVNLSLSNISIDEGMDMIQEKLPFSIELPKFIGNREADILTTKYGILTDRHLHALYLAKRVIELCPDRNSRILEIGGGLGLLGYYLLKAGYKDYTTIDLAYTNAVQAYFFSKNFADKHLMLSGELPNTPYETCIKLLHSCDFEWASSNQYDLIVNMDGLTEMPPNDAFKYFISPCAPLFLSINHEVNDFRVCELDKSELHRKRNYRYPFWLRDGYVEELYKLV